MWAARAKRRAASRQLLMAACAAGAGAGGLGEDADEARAARGAMLEEVDALMWASMLDAAATWLTVFDSIVRPLQASGGAARATGASRGPGAPAGLRGPTGCRRLQGRAVPGRTAGSRL
jgi:hypothetical protein